MMSDKSCKTRVEQKENSAQQDQSTEIGKRRRSKYYTRAAKKLEEEIFERKQSCVWEAEAAEKRLAGISKSKHSSEKEAQMFKQTFPSFKSKMIELYGETFFYNCNGGFWHGQMSRRYRHYHLTKSMRFLRENMNSSDNE